MEKISSPSVIPSTEIKTKFSDITSDQFPSDFVFGVGTSAYQHEGSAAKGGRGLSTWDVFTLKTPGKIADGSNGNVAVDMYSKYKEDIKMMKSMGFDAYRFSISWPRILPGGRTCLGVNQEGIDYYNDLINTILENEMEPFVTLFHWDLPYCLEQEYGGFLDIDSDNIKNDFREFAELCFWEFGDRVKYWITLNEPWTYAVNGYVRGTFPSSMSTPYTVPVPGQAPIPIDPTSSPSSEKTKNNYISYRGALEQPNGLLLVPSERRNYASFGCSDPAKEAYIVARNLLLAHAEAVDTYKNNFKKHQNGYIGISLVSHWFEPYTNDGEDIKAANRALDFMLGWFLEPILTGQYPQSMRDRVDGLEPFSQDEINKLKGSIDFLGLNYYTANYAANDPYPTCPKGYYRDQHVAYYTEKDGIPIGPLAGSCWLYIYPEGIYRLLTKYVKENYNKYMSDIPIYITENGVDEKNDPTLTAYQACDDAAVRLNYHRDHLGYILTAMIEHDVKVKGYFAWSWCDNFEWIEGYTVRFGLIYIDYMNYLKRYPKRSALWFANKFLANKKAHKKHLTSKSNEVLKESPEIDEPVKSP